MPGDKNWTLQDWENNDAKMQCTELQDWYEVETDEGTDFIRCSALSPVPEGNTQEWLRHAVAPYVKGNVRRVRLAHVLVNPVAFLPALHNIEEYLAHPDIQEAGKGFALPISNPLRQLREIIATFEEITK